MSTFKIQGVGLDTTNLEYPMMDNEECYDYILTNLNSNNDGYLKDYLSKNSSVLIVKTGFLDSVELSLRGHLKELGRDQVSLLLVESGADWNKLESLPIVSSWGVVHPSKEDLIKADSALTEKGLKLEYVLMSACPLDYDAELFDIINSMGLTVLIDNPMGGNLSAARNIEAFTVPYLLSFAANQGSVVFLSSRDLSKASESVEYLKSLIGKPSNSMFELRKTIQKPVKPVKKVIYTSVKVSESIIIPYDSPGFLNSSDSTVFSLGKWKETLPELEDPEEDSVESKIRYLLGVTHLPEDASRESLFTHLRYRVKDYIEGYLGGEYKIEYDYTDHIMLISATKPSTGSGSLWWYKFTPESKRYFCFVLGQDKTPKFYEINSPTEVEIP